MAISGGEMAISRGEMAISRGEMAISGGDLARLPRVTVDHEDDDGDERAERVARGAQRGA